jgi:hypothetical protein
MHFLALLFFYLALAISSTFAKLPLPQGYWTTAVTDLGSQETSESRDEPYAPLLNATAAVSYDTVTSLRPDKTPDRRTRKA